MCGPQIGVSALMGLLLGLLYSDVGHGQQSISDRKGILFFVRQLPHTSFRPATATHAHHQSDHRCCSCPASSCWLWCQVCINQAFGLIGMVTGAFPKERKVVERERAGNAYHISAYYLAKVSSQAWPPTAHHP